MLVLEDFVHSQRVFSLSGIPVYLASLVLADFVRMSPLVNYMHRNGNVVYPRTVELGVFGFAEFALEYLQLINYIFIFVSEIGVQFIVHL